MFLRSRDGVLAGVSVTASVGAGRNEQARLGSATARAFHLDAFEQLFCKTISGAGMHA